MNIFSRVSVFALGPLVGTACRAAGLSAVADGSAAVTRFLAERLTDQSLRVTDALGRKPRWRSSSLIASASGQPWTTKRYMPIHAGERSMLA